MGKTNAFPVEVAMTSSALSLELDTPDLARHHEQVGLARQFRAGQVWVQRLALLPGIRLTSARLVAVASKASRS